MVCNVVFSLLVENLDEDGRRDLDEQLMAAVTRREQLAEERLLEEFGGVNARRAELAAAGGRWASVAPDGESAAAGGPGDEEAAHAGLAESGGTSPTGGPAGG